MAKRATYRKRCTECRQWFTPPARLAKQQCVCSGTCRRARRRKQARARRAREPARYREEERERKRRSREKARDDGAGAKARPCHEPGDAAKQMKSRQEFSDLWDKVMGVSRAGLERQVRKIAKEIWLKMGQDFEQRDGGHAPGDFFIHVR